MDFSSTTASKILNSKENNSKQSFSSNIVPNNYLSISILNDLTNGIIITDDRGNITLMNSVAEKISGWSLNDALGKYITKVFSVTNSGTNLFSDDLITKSIERKLIYHPEADKLFVLVSRHGNQTYVKFKITPLYENKKDINGFALIFEDLSGLNKVKEALKEKEDSYVSLITSSYDPIFIYQNKKLVLVNPAWAKLFGYPQEKVYGEGFDILNIIAPQDKRKAEDIFNLLLKKTNKNSNANLRGISSDGGIIDLEFSFLDITWRGKKAVQCTLKDITYMRRAEGIFKMLNLAVEQSPASILITNTSGEIKYVNPQFTSKTGYTLKEIYGLKPESISWGETTPEEFKRLWSSISNGNDWKGELFNRKKDGTSYWDIASISPIRNEQGEITHVIAVSEDITDIKEQKEQLRIAKEKAEKADKLKSEFITQMSHEIRTPLNNILNSIWFLEQATENLKGKELKEPFEILKKSSNRLTRTVELIIILSKIQSQTYDLNTELLNLEEDILQQLMLEFFTAAQAKNIDFTYEQTTSHCKILGDSFSLNQIFTNLFDNAFKYTNKGKVTVKLYKYSEGEIAVDIADTGLGISEEYLPHIFEPFSQEDTGDTRNYEGSGLGLALVKSCVELNNAKIKVISEKNVGSTFTVIFPLNN